MKKLFLFSVAATLISSLSFATIRRVGFFGPAVSGVDYASFGAAVTAASAGDTIMMMPGAEFAGNPVTKKIIIIGPGYFLNPSDPTFPGNDGLQVNNNSTGTGNQLYFDQGSENSQVIGCSFMGIVIRIPGEANILLKRCRFSSGNPVFIQTALSNITFQQCFIDTDVRNYNAFSVTNISFLNCLFGLGGYIDFAQGSTSGIISNCVFAGSNAAYVGGGAWQVSNSITNASFNGTNLVYNNNISTGNQIPAGNGNQQNKPWTDIFTLSGSYDGKYTLKPGSPAIGAGINGAVATDCGIFGGPTPYRLSGIPSVPTIYQLTSPQGTIPAGNTVQINLSTRSNN